MSLNNRLNIFIQESSTKNRVLLLIEIAYLPDYLKAWKRVGVKILKAQELF